MNKFYCIHNFVDILAAWPLLISYIFYSNICQISKKTILFYIKKNKDNFYIRQQRNKKSETASTHTQYHLKKKKKLVSGGQYNNINFFTLFIGSLNSVMDFNYIFYTLRL